MNNNFHITSSIVVFNNPRDMLTRAISSFLKTNLLVKLYLIDNSPADDLRGISNDPRVEYIHNPSNPGFGAAHNIAIQKAIEMNSSYHFVINPDVYFTEDVIEEMIKKIQSDDSIGMIMPGILNIDGSKQYLPKLLPSPWHMIWRKLKRPSNLYKRFLDKYELREVSSITTLNVPILSGCFTLLNLKAIQKVGFYDDNFFMYFEDWDLSRRMHKKFKTLYFPKVSVYHGYHSGANHNFKLFKIFIKSYFYYFSKWGWIFDKERDEINKRALNQLK